MTAWADAVRDAPGGAVLDLEVVPGATRDEFPAGYNPWRRTVQARVAAPAVGGAANAALVALLARFFEVPARDVRLVAGESGRRKRLQIAGRSRADVLARLGP